MADIMVPHGVGGTHTVPLALGTDGDQEGGVPLGGVLDPLDIDHLEAHAQHQVNQMYTIILHTSIYKL